MIRIAQRDSSTNAYKVRVRMFAVLSALAISAILLLFLGYNPLSVFGSMLDGGLGSSYRFKETVVRTIPLVIASLGISLAFRMRFWNIGGEGQIMIGAFAATGVGLFLPGIPRPLLLLLMAAAGLVGGGLWALFPTFFKVKYRTDETILTLMMNYVALKWLTYLQYVAWRDEEAFGYPKIPNLETSAQLPDVFGIHIGWLLVPILVAALALLIRYTKFGYEIRVIGGSERTAQYAGMNVPWIIGTTLFLSGALCGLVGMIQVSGVNSTLSVEVSGGVGYTAIIIAWLAQLNAVAILIASFLFAVMVEGGSFIQTVYQIPLAAAEILQGLILFAVIGSEFFIRYRVILTRRETSVEAGSPGEAGQ